MEINCGGWTCSLMTSNEASLLCLAGVILRDLVGSQIFDCLALLTRLFISNVESVEIMWSSRTASPRV